MSRSNPTVSIPNPCTRWMEWRGKEGDLKYWDKEEEKNVVVPLPYTFLLLDQLSTVKGWNDASESNIFCNEVRDTRSETLLVQSFKGGVIAEGFYSQIKDRVKAQGGYYVSNLYIAYKEGELKVGSIQFKKAALREWSEFVQNNKANIYKKAIVIDGFKEGKKGSVVFKVPTFRLKEIDPSTNEKATALDSELQKYLSAYFAKNKVEQAVPHTPQPTQEIVTPSEDSDDIPF